MDAASTGLLCIGSYIAFENIAISPNVSCVLYNEASEIPQILKEVVSDKEKFQEYAIRARNNVRKYHDVNLAVNQIIGLLYGEVSNLEDYLYLSSI